MGPVEKMPVWSSTGPLSGKFSETGKEFGVKGRNHEAESDKTQNMLLEYFQQHPGETLQGEVICKYLGVQKDVLSRHCKKLKDRGHKIISSGYTYFPQQYSVPEKNTRFQESVYRKVGRPCDSVPTNLEPLLKTFRDAAVKGNAFSRTGKNGVHARRNELPEEFRGIGRDRLENLVREMMNQDKN